MVYHEHQGHQPAEMIHHRQAEHRVAHLADRRVGQQPLGIFLENGHQVAEQGREGTHPHHHMGQLDAVQVVCLPMCISSINRPNRPALSRIPETIGETSVSASACAPGSQICRPMAAVLVMNPIASSRNTQGASGSTSSPSAGQGKLRCALRRQREAGQDQEGATEREHQVGQGMRFGLAAAQNQEIGADGQRFPGSKEIERVLGQDQHRQAGIHQHR